MNLDGRIIDKKKIFDSFEIEEAEKYLGKEGYFANSNEMFSNLDNCIFGKLEEINDDIKPYSDSYLNYRYFLPSEFVKEKSAYRPFKDAKEFFIKTNFEAGDLIHIRFKNKIEYWLMLVGWTNNVIELGTDNFTFEDLFENFELWDGENFIPFGVEE